jgi:hypothetical protein
MHLRIRTAVIVAVMKVGKMRVRVRVIEGLMRVFVRVPQARRRPRVRMGMVQVIMAVGVDMNHLVVSMTMSMPRAKHEGDRSQEYRHSACLKRDSLSESRRNEKSIPKKGAPANRI